MQQFCQVRAVGIKESGMAADICKAIMRDTAIFGAKSGKVTDPVVD